MYMNFICEKCGKKYGRETYTKTSTKQTKEFWRERENSEYGKCSDCYKAEQEEKAKEQATGAGLPELTGSEKQIAWAEKIRLIKYNSLQPLPNMTPKGIAAYDKLFSTTEAKYWIDNRDFDVKELMQKIAASLPEELEAEIKADEEAERKAKTQILQPEKPTDETPVEIRVSEDSVVVFSKKDEKIIGVCKGKGYKWVNGAWRKTMSFRSGTVVDRAADIGNKLLNMGYPVTIDNLEAAEKAVNARFESECTRWVSVSNKPESRSLMISWTERDEELYNTARSLPKSSYDSPYVVVPVKYYREVEDFAQLYGFKLSPGAIRKINEYKDSLEIKQVHPVEAPKSKEPKGVKSIMENMEVIEDLKEDENL